VAPQQDRSTRRLASFLQAAAELFAVVGYEATTMQAIADRSDSSIGALFNYFPDKESVAATLRQQSVEDLQSRVKSLMVVSNKLPAVRFAEAFIDCIIDFVQDRLAWLNVVAAPISFHRAQSARRALESPNWRRSNPLADGNAR